MTIREQSPEEKFLADAAGVALLLLFLGLPSLPRSAMIAAPVKYVQDAIVGGRRLRVHSLRADPIDWSAVVARDLDDDDRERLTILGALLASGAARGVAHAEIVEQDVLHVYLEQPDGAPMFACVLLPELLVREDLDAGRDVVEGASLEVVPDGVAIDDAIRPALQSWARRNFPELGVVRFDIAFSAAAAPAKPEEPQGP
jgi:hypothetical protein